jgi:hypothetical protein
MGQSCRYRSDAGECLHELYLRFHAIKQPPDRSWKTMYDRYFANINHR